MATSRVVTNIMHPGMLAPAFDNDEQFAAFMLARIHLAVRELESPAVVDGWLRRHFLACTSGVGRRSQARLIRILLSKEQIELCLRDGEQWIRPIGELPDNEMLAMARP